MKIAVNYRRDYFLFFFVANIYSVFYLITSGVFLGFESAGQFPVDFQLSLFVLIFLFSYYFILFPVFGWLSRIDFLLPSLGRGCELSLFSSSVLILQVLYLFFVLYFDAGKVGVGKIALPFSNFWAFIQIDFLTTYALMLTKKNNVWLVNIFLFAISNLIRGWTGFLLILFFIYLVRREKSIILSVKNIVTLVMAVLVIIPLSTYIKFYIRSGGAINGIDFLSIMFGLDNYLDFFIYSIEYFINRVQQLSLTWFVWDSSKFLSLSYANELIRPFWSENLYGNFFIKSFGVKETDNLGMFSVQYIPFAFEIELGSFNISPGLIGWMGVVGNAGGFFAYLCFLFIISFVILQLICRRKSREWLFLTQLMWLMWLLLLMPGWLNQFVAFLHAGLMVVIFLIVFRSLNFKDSSVKW